MKKSLKRVLSMALSTVMVASSLTLGGFTIVPAAESAVTIYACEGVQEAAYVEWAAVSGTDHYYVSYAKSGSNDFKQIDDELIRQYPDRWRADLVGLAAGNYTIKVTCKDSGGGTIAESTHDCTVIAQDRTGYAFSPNSIAYDNGGSGAYNADGTLKSGANVLYITEDNFDTVTLTLKDKENEDYTATGLADICYTMGQAAQKGNSNPPLAVRFLGTISDSHDGLASKQILETKANGNAKVNITFEGIGEDTIFDGLGLRLNGVANCEIRNIAFWNWHDDAIQLQGNENSNHWIHNNDLFYGENHGGDQAKGDGATDVKDDSRYITYSYNHYWDSGKTSLCGMKSETGDNYISYHHNWFDHSDSRHPRIRTMFVHVYNNYYDGNSKYGVGAAKDSSAFVEGNYFRNCKYPMLSSMQGSDIATGDGTFSSENGGIIKAYNNYIEGGRGVIYYNASTAPVEFDAYLASSRDEAVPSSVKAKQGGKTFDNSNVDSYILSIPVEEPAAAKTKVESYAGRIGNDFIYTFNNSVDDTDYEINTALASAVSSYVSDTSDDFVSYGGASDGSGPVSTTTTTTEATTEAPSETTTEEVTEVTTFSDPVEVGEAVTGFTPDTDSGAGVSVVYDEPTNSWILTDTSSTAAAELTIPFAEQTSGRIVISGTATPSTTASKWMFVQIRGTKADGTSGEIIALGGGATKGDLSVRVNGASTYDKLGELSAKSLKYTIVIDLDNDTADVTIDGLKETYNLDVASISSLYSTTSVSSSRNVTISVPYVGVLTGEAPVVTTTEASSEATTTEVTTEGSTESTTVNPSGAASMGTYVIGDLATGGDFNVNEEDIFGNVNFENVRTLEDEGVKLRSGNEITFTLAAETIIEITCGGGSDVVLSNGSNTYTCNADATTKYTVPAGAYTISGANNSNSLVTKIVLTAVGGGEEPDDESSSSTTESTTEATTASATTTTEAATEKPTEGTTEATEYLTIESDQTLNRNNVASSKYFNVTGYNEDNTSVIQLPAAGEIEFTVKAGATVTITAKHASSDTTAIDRTLTLSGSSGDIKTITYSQGANEKTDTLGTDLAAGTYTITTSNSINISSLAVTFPTEPVEPGFVKGDANDDGQVTIDDVRAILNQVVGIGTVANADAADVNDDDKVTSRDAYIIHYFVKNGEWKDR